MPTPATVPQAGVNAALICLLFPHVKLVGYVFQGSVVLVKVMSNVLIKVGLILAMMHWTLQGVNVASICQVMHRVMS